VDFGTLYRRLSTHYWLFATFEGEATPDPTGLGQEEAIRILAGVSETGDQDPLLLSIDLIEDDYSGRVN
jgi:hypothetical protein